MPHQTSIKNRHLKDYDDIYHDPDLFPLINISENRQDIVFHILLPGISAKNIHIHLKDNEIMLSGFYASEPGLFHCKERYSGKFKRSILIHCFIDPSRISAIFTHGVLQLCMAKAPHVMSSQTILIHIDQEEL